jgi:hypothetical protein
LFWNKKVVNEIFTDWLLIPILNQSAIFVSDAARRMPGASSASSIRLGGPASPPPCRLDIIFDLEMVLVISYSPLPELGLKNFIKSGSDSTFDNNSVQISAIEIMVNHPLKIGSPEPVLP